MWKSGIAYGDQPATPPPCGGNPIPPPPPVEEFRDCPGCFRQNWAGRVVTLSVDSWKMGEGGKGKKEGEGVREVLFLFRSFAHALFSLLKKTRIQKLKSQNKTKKRQPRLPLHLEPRGLLEGLHGPHHERDHGQRVFFLRPPRG